MATQQMCHRAVFVKLLRTLNQHKPNYREFSVTDSFEVSFGSSQLSHRMFLMAIQQMCLCAVFVELVVRLDEHFADFREISVIDSFQVALGSS